MSKKYVIHLTLWEVTVEDDVPPGETPDEDYDLLEEEEVLGLQDEYEGYLTAYEDFNRFSKKHVTP